MLLPVLQVVLWTKLGNPYTSCVVVMVYDDDDDDDDYTFYLLQYKYLVAALLVPVYGVCWCFAGGAFGRCGLGLWFGCECRYDDVELTVPGRESTSQSTNGSFTDGMCFRRRWPFLVSLAMMWRHTVAVVQ